MHQFTSSLTTGNPGHSKADGRLKNLQQGAAAAAVTEMAEAADEDEEEGEATLDEADTAPESQDPATPEVGARTRVQHYSKLIQSFKAL